MYGLNKHTYIYKCTLWLSQDISNTNYGPFVLCSEWYCMIVIVGIAKKTNGAVLQFINGLYDIYGILMSQASSRPTLYTEQND